MNDETFVLAPLVPLTWAVRCTQCEALIPLDDFHGQPAVREDDAGTWRAEAHATFHRCDCGALLQAAGAEVRHIETDAFWSRRW